MIFSINIDCQYWLLAPILADIIELILYRVP